MALQVLHLSTYDANGGAARAAYSLHRALLAQGVKSRMRVGIKHTDDPTVVQGRRAKFITSSLLDRQLWRLQRSPRTTWRSPARFSSIYAKEINESGADVVNLHWITDGFISIEELGKIEIPIVLSMYDMWPFSGTEHYGNIDSRRWRDGYTRQNRPADESGFDLDRWTFNRKVKSWSAKTRPFHMVPASTWLESATRESCLMREWPITRIPHPVNENIFRALDKSAARLRMGIDPERPTIGFLAAAGIGDTRKGFDLLVDAMGEVRRAFPQAQVMVVGPIPSPESLPADPQFRYVGEAYGDTNLATAYEACDVLAVPSREDNMPLTAMEAQISGRPVVGFRIGGLLDIVEHQTTGYLATPWDTSELATGLQLALEGSLSGGAWGMNARERGINRWSYGHVARDYVDVYQGPLS